MFEPAKKMVRECGATDDEVEISIESALRFWLMFTNVAGTA